jgi:hypothetical protein
LNHSTVFRFDIKKFIRKAQLPVSLWGNRQFRLKGIRVGPPFLIREYREATFPVNDELILE